MVSARILISFTVNYLTFFSQILVFGKTISTSESLVEYQLNKTIKIDLLGACRRDHHTNLTLPLDNHESMHGLEENRPANWDFRKRLSETLAMNSTEMVQKAVTKRNESFDKLTTNAQYGVSVLQEITEKLDFLSGMVTDMINKVSSNMIYKIKFISIFTLFHLN